MTEENYKTVKKYYIILFVLSALAVAAGAMFYVKRYSGSDDIKSYIEGFVQRAKDGTDCRRVMINSMKMNAVTAALIIFGALIKPGCIVTAGEIVRRGFISGFTCACFMGVYGINGIFMTLTGLVGIMIAAPATLMMASISIAASLGRPEANRRFKMFYIFCAIFFVAIFCIVSVCEGYLTTTFMKWIL